MKRVTSILLALILVCSFISPVFAEGNEYSFNINSTSLTYSEEGNVLSTKATNITDQSASGILIAALYSADYKLLEFFSTDITATSSGTAEVSFNVTSNKEDIDFAKVFIWDSLTNIKPIAEAKDAEMFTSVYYATLLSVTENDEVVLLKSDGTETTLKPVSGFDLTAIKERLSTAGTDISKRLANYKVKSATGDLASIEFIGDDAVLIDGEYKIRTGKLSAYTISDSTNIIDATNAAKSGDMSKASNYKVFDKDQLAEGTSYIGYAISYGRDTPFVVLTSIVEKTVEENHTSARFAVVQKKAVPYSSDDEYECELVLALYDGRSEHELLFVTGVADDLEAGDAFFFETDTIGLINKVYKVYDNSSGTFTTLADAADYMTDDWSYNLWNENCSIQLARGAIIEANDTTITFASLEQVKTGSLNATLDLNDTQGDGVVTYPIADDAVAYVYDINNDDLLKEVNKFSAKSPSSIKASNLDKYESADEPYVYTNIDMADVNEALVKIVEGSIVEIYAIEK